MRITMLGYNFCTGGAMLVHWFIGLMNRIHIALLERNGCSPIVYRLRSLASLGREWGKSGDASAYGYLYWRITNTPYININRT